MRALARLLVSLPLFACSGGGSPTSPVAAQIPVQIRGTVHSGVAITHDSVGAAARSRSPDSGTAHPSTPTSHDSVSGTPVAGVDPNALVP